MASVMRSLTCKELKQPLPGQKEAVLWRTLHMVVEQGAARKPLTPLAVPAFRFYLVRSLLSFINAVLNATSKELKRRHLSFNLLERVMRRGFQKPPI